MSVQAVSGEYLGPALEPRVGLDRERKAEFAFTEDFRKTHTTPKNLRDHSGQTMTALGLLGWSCGSSSITLMAGGQSRGSNTGYILESTSFPTLALHFVGYTLWVFLPDHLKLGNLSPFILNSNIPTYHRLANEK